MDESTRILIEVAFNIVYLACIWALVFVMIRRQQGVSQADQPLTQLFIWAFGLLALGDTGHVGFRVVAFASGDLERTVTLFNREIGLVGLGALSTSLTVTFFYVLMLVIWQRRFGRPYQFLGIALFVVAAVRLIIILFPQNEWNSTVPPQPWSLYRNLPLTILGVGVAYLILRDAIARHDATFTWIGSLIVVSYIFYAPVILWVQQVPAVGMLMIPKTLAYLAIAIIAFRDLFPKPVSGNLATQ